MSNWTHRLDLTDVWRKAQNGDMTIQELGNIVGARLEKLSDRLPPHYQEQALEIAANFKAVDEDADEFDEYMNELYDLGDTITHNAHSSMPDKLIWIATNF